MKYNKLFKVLVIIITSLFHSGLSVMLLLFGTLSNRYGGFEIANPLSYIGYIGGFITAIATLHYMIRGNKTSFMILFRLTIIIFLLWGIFVGFHEMIALLGIYLIIFIPILSHYRTH